MSEIVVVGDETFTLGFELVGITAYSLDKLESLFETSKDIGIVIISQEEYETLSAKLRGKIDRTLKPIVVIMSKDDIKGNNLREAIIRALGVDLLAQNN